MSDILTDLNTALEGHYRVERELGSGGMATVYLAEDLKHDRNVAIKVLKPELAAVLGAERFLAEIKTTANLQHPHILPLFDSGEADGFLYYVMPFVDGETLRDRIDREKQLPVEDAVRIASAVAGALDYAHRHDVIHRDIKPANILIHDGQPVVADFGIALAVSAAGGGRLTETGLSLGTPHYMSPEQATADRDLSAQSDIYALACVLYEMLTGAPPFSGPTAQAVLMQILTETAKPVTALRKSVPPHVAAALDKALEKLPADRFPTAEAFSRAVNDPAYGPARPVTGAIPTRKTSDRGWERMLWPGIAAIASMLAVVAFLRPGESGGVTRFVLTTEGGSVNLASVTNKLDISPDGRTVAYIANSPSGLPGIYLHHLDDLEPTLLLSAQTTTLEFSPDGQSLAFDEALSLRRISIAGGPPTTLVTNAVEDVSVRWSTDGHVYYNGPGFVLLRVPEEGGTPEAVYTRVDENDFGVSSPFVLPGGRAALVDMSGPARTNPHVGYLDLTTGAIDTLIAGSSPRLILDRYMTWVSADGVLLVAPFDEAGRRLEGQGISMVEDVRIEQFIEPEYAVSDNGTLVYRRVTSESGSKLVSVTRDGTEAEYSYPIQSQLGIRLSPDGRYVTFEEGFGVVPDIWTLELATGTRTRITFEAGAFYPDWTPDGRRVAYSKPLQGETGLFWKNSDGSGVEEPLLRDPGLSEVEVVFLPDGERFLVRGGDQSRAESADLLMYEIGSDAPGLPIASAEGNELSPMVSPDGRFVAYSSDELGSAEVFVRSLERPEERWQVSTRGGREPLWHPEGTEIFFRTDTHVFSVPVSTEDGFRRLGEAERLFEAGRYLSNANHTSYEVFPDGDTFLFLGQGATPETVVVLNWLDEVRARLQR